MTESIIVRSSKYKYSYLCRRSRSCLANFLLLFCAFISSATASQSESKTENMVVKNVSEVRILPEYFNEESTPVEIFSFKADDSEAAAIKAECKRLSAECDKDSLLVYLDKSGVVKMLIATGFAKDNKVVVFTAERRLDFLIRKDEVFSILIEDWRADYGVSHSCTPQETLRKIKGLTTAPVFSVEIEDYLPKCDGGILVDDDGNKIGEGQLLFQTSITINTR
jgi:hypothetical protein